MAGIILKILSIIGILILVLMGLFLVFLLIILFMPIRYKVSAKRADEKTELEIKIRWLLHLVRLDYCYPTPAKLSIKILGKTLDTSKKEPVRNDVEASNEHSEEKHQKDSSTESHCFQDIQNKKNDVNLEEIVGENASAQNNHDDKNADDPEEKEVKGYFEKIKYKFASIYDKIIYIKNNISYYTELLRDEETGLLCNHFIDRVYKILKALRPSKMVADIRFGTGSPDTTGYILGIYSIFSPLFGTKVNVTPDFELQILQGSIFVKGKIPIFVLVHHTLHFMLDRRLKTFIRRVKKGGNSNGR